MINHYGNAPRFIHQSMNKAIVRTGYSLARLLAHTRYKLKLNISDDDLARLNALNNSRSIIMPNHPTPSDWLVMYLLSAKLVLPFHYMTAHEQFYGTRRLWLPKFGAYSIRRGGWGDIKSVSETFSILQRPPCSLVMFPEGRCSFSSRSVLEFKVGAVKIGLNYLKRLARPQQQDLYLVPVAIRYQYVESIDSRLKEGLERLEQHIPTTTTDTLCTRISYQAQTIVASLEDQYGLGSTETTMSWRQRIMCLCDEILRISEQSLGIYQKPRTGITNRVCNIRQILAIQGHCHGIVTSAKYQQAYYPTLLALVLESFGELNLTKPLSLSSQADLLYSLERIVYKISDPVPVGLRQAIIRVGEAINLADYLDDYCADKNGVSHRILKLLQAGVEYNLTNEVNIEEPAALSLNSTKIDVANENSTDPSLHG